MTILLELMTDYLIVIDLMSLVIRTARAADPYWTLQVDGEEAR